MDIDEVMLSVWILAGAAGLVLLAGLLTVVLQRLLYICPPNQVLIFSGRERRMADGSVVGYHVVRGGRRIRIPLIEKVSSLDMRTFPVQVVVANAFSKGGIPLTVQAIANVKISSDPAQLHSAAERFLDVPVQRIAEVAQDTLEGALREVLASLTPEEVNEDRLKFADSLMHNAGDDFARLGLHLDVLKIQHVSDEQAYLTNLGREAIANMLRDAENAENEANQTIAEAEATTRSESESAQKQAEAEVLQKRNEYEAQLAKLNAIAAAAENEALVDAETARAKAEQELQELRKQYEQLRLHCDVVLPAQAKRKADGLKAQGEAAPVVEDGKARAAALGVLAAEWSAAGRAGREVYVLNHLRDLAEAAVTRAGETQVGELHVVDGGDGTNLAAVVSSFPVLVREVMHQTAQAMGVDLDAVMGSRKAGG